MASSSSAPATHIANAGSSADDQKAVDAIIQELHQKIKPSAGYSKQVESAVGAYTVSLVIFCLLVVGIAIGLLFFFSRSQSKGGQGKLQFLLGSKIIMSFSALIFLMTGLGAYAVHSFDTIGEYIEEIAEEIVPILNAVAKRRTSLSSLLPLNGHSAMESRRGRMPKKSLRKRSEFLENCLLRRIMN